MMEALFSIAVLFGIIIVLSLFTYFVPIGLWITAYFAGVKVAIFRDLVGMRLRKVPPGAIVRPKISADKAGIEVPLDRMEAHFLAGGNVEAVILALISADKANIELTFERAAAIDLAGRDVLDAVKVMRMLHSHIRMMGLEILMSSQARRLPISMSEVC